MSLMIQRRGGTGNWQHGEQQSLDFKFVFRRQIVTGQKSSRKGVLLQYTKVLKDQTPASVRVNSCTKLYLYRLLPE